MRIWSSNRTEMSSSHQQFHFLGCTIHLSFLYIDWQRCLYTWFIWYSEEICEAMHTNDIKAMRWSISICHKISFAISQNYKQDIEVVIFLFNFFSISLFRLGKGQGPGGSVIHSQIVTAPFLRPNAHPLVIFFNGYNFPIWKYPSSDYQHHFKSLLSFSLKFSISSHFRKVWIFGRSPWWISNIVRQ